MARYFQFGTGICLRARDNCYRSIILVIPKMFLYGCDIFNGNGALEVDTMRSWREWVFLD